MCTHFRGIPSSQSVISTYIFLKIACSCEAVRKISRICRWLVCTCVLFSGNILIPNISLSISLFFSTLLSFSISFPYSKKLHGYLQPNSSTSLFYTHMKFKSYFLIKYNCLIMKDNVISQGRVSGLFTPSTS